MNPQTQRAKWRRAAAQKVARRRASGLCITCGQTAPKGRATCPDCATAATDRNRRRRATIAL